MTSEIARLAEAVQLEISQLHSLSSDPVWKLVLKQSKQADLQIELQHMQRFETFVRCFAIMCQQRDTIAKQKDTIATLMSYFTFDEERA